MSIYLTKDLRAMSKSCAGKIIDDNLTKKDLTLLFDAIVEKFLNDVDENTDRKNYRDKILESPSEELFDF